VSVLEGSSPQQLEWQRMAAECAVCYVESGMVVGLGTGSTAAFAVRRIGHLLQAGRLERIVGVPTSRRVELAAREHGIPLRSLDEEPVVDVTIDGADEVDPELNLIKGRGGAMLHEKIVARASRCEIIVVDESKLVPRLGAHGLLPVEVVPFGWSVVARELAALGIQPVRRMVDGEPVLTDEGNFVLDCRLDGIADPAALDVALHATAGVVEHGLFLGLANMVVVAGRDGLRLLRSGETSCRDERCYRYATGRDR
jgi:ribose 5-phosphate isomerase A